MNLNRKAALMSGLVFPGMGQIYKKHFLKAAAMIVPTAALIILLFYNIFQITWKTMNSMDMSDFNGVNIDPKMFADINHQAWVQNELIIVLVIVIWIGSIVDAAYTKTKEEPETIPYLTSTKDPNVVDRRPPPKQL